MKQVKKAAARAAVEAELNVSGHYKITNFRAQKQLITDFLACRPLTRLQLSRLMQVERASVCWQVGALLREGVVQVHHYGPDPITGFRGVQFLALAEDCPDSFLHREGGVK